MSFTWLVNLVRPNIIKILVLEYHITAVIYLETAFVAASDRHSPWKSIGEHVFSCDQLHDSLKLLIDLQLGAKVQWLSNKTFLRDRFWSLWLYKHQANQKRCASYKLWWCYSQSYVKAAVLLFILACILCTWECKVRCGDGSTWHPLFCFYCAGMCWHLKWESD